MKRTIALLSVAITAFSVIILASVVYGYRVLAETRPAPVAADESQQESAAVIDPIAASFLPNAAVVAPGSRRVSPRVS